MSVSTEAYMYGVEERLDELSNFQDWALQKFTDKDKCMVVMNEKVKDLQMVKQKNTPATHVETEYRTPVFGLSSQYEIDQTLSPTTPSSTKDLRTARMSPMVARCKSPSLWEDNCSEDCTASP